MEKYEQISVVGEGSYGVVMKCRHKESGQLVAIKKFLETEEDLTVRKMALREIRMLKRLHHDNLVNMIEVFRRRRRFFLVFEYLEHTLLDELEACGGGGGGLRPDTARKHLFQIVRGIEYCHLNNVIHRDVKPENVLVSKSGIVKLCDFGFARSLAQPGELYTEYVATRWYRAPELLVGDPRYGPEVDIWAIGCLFVEMLTGDPLFPGESEIDQLALIVKMVGELAARHAAAWRHGPGTAPGATMDPLTDPCRPEAPPPAPLAGALRDARAGDEFARALIVACLQPEPMSRPTACDILRHRYFTRDNFTEGFVVELRKKISKELQAMPLLRKESHIRSGRTDSTVSIAKVRRDVSYHEMPSRWRISFKQEGKTPKQSLESMDASNLSLSSATMKRAKIQTSNISVADEINSLKHTSSDYITTGKIRQTIGDTQVEMRSPIGSERYVSPIQFQSLQPLNPVSVKPHSIVMTSLTPLQFTCNRPPKNAKNPNELPKASKRSGMMVEPSGRRKDGFTLPNVPGAVVSPVKGKTKLQPLGNHNSNVKEGGDLSRTGNLPYM